MPDIRHSNFKEVNKRIKHAIEVRSSERMHKEHITPLTLVFKDTHLENKVHIDTRWVDSWGETCVDRVDVACSLICFCCCSSPR